MHSGWHYCTPSVVHWKYKLEFMLFLKLCIICTSIAVIEESGISEIRVLFLYIPIYEIHWRYLYVLLWSMHTLEWVNFIEAQLSLCWFSPDTVILSKQYSALQIWYTQIKIYQYMYIHVPGHHFKCRCSIISASD